MRHAIQMAIDKAGGMRPLARAIGINYQSIQGWKTRIPAERVLDVEHATGIPRENPPSRISTGSRLFARENKQPEHSHHPEQLEWPNASLSRA